MSTSGRRWLEVSVRCPTAGALHPLLADALLELGGRATEERGGWFVTHLPDPGDLESFLRSAETTLAESSGLEGIEVRLDWQDHEEWAETWKRGLDQRRVGQRIVVRPSWIEPSGLSPEDLVIEVDPGMAFGTAEHGTTRGCLRLLECVVQEGDRVLDVGAGSGILSVAAAKLGAADVVAVEGDEYACEAMRANLAANGVIDAVQVDDRWADPELIRTYGVANGVVANIEAGLLLPLFPALAGAVAGGGWMIVSGILESEWSTVSDTLEGLGLQPGEVDPDGEWRSGVFTRPV